MLEIANQKIMANFFNITISPHLIKLYKSPLIDFDEIVSQKFDFVRITKDSYLTLKPTKRSEETQEFSNEQIAWLIRNIILSRISENPDYFDVDERKGYFTLRREKEFEENNLVILRRISLQVIYHNDGYYIVFNPFLKTYLRIGLEKILDIYPEIKSHLKQRKALVYFEQHSLRKWLPAKILYTDDLATIELRNNLLDKYQVQYSRVIPFLNRKEILDFINKSGGKWNYDETIKKIKYNSSVQMYHSTNKILQNTFIKLFPINAGEYKLALNPEMQSFQKNKSYSAIDSSINYVVERGSITEVGKHRLKAMSNISIKNNFTKKNVILISTEEHIKDLRQTINTLNNGIVSGNFKFSMPDKFGIQLNVIKEKIASDEKGYHQITEELLASIETNIYDSIVIIYLPKRSDYYLPLKAKLASHGIVSQIISQKNYDINSCWNLGTNLYAKMGYKPWGIATTDPNLLADLIIGFSYSQLKSESGLNRNIGYVNVFDKNGVWQFMNTATEYLDFQNRHILIPKMISQAILSFKTTQQKLTKIDIHYSKKFSKRERIACIDEINRVLPEVKEICFISIDNSHEMHLYDPKHTKYEVDCGIVMPLNKNSFLLTTTDRKNTINPLRPLKITVWYDVNSSEINYDLMANRIIALTKLNWRSAIRDSSEPVTLKYSEEIAYLTNYFYLTEWKTVNNILSKIPWFI